MGIVLPMAEITTSPSIMVGIERMASFSRLSALSRNGPPTAARIPSVIPTT